MSPATSAASIRPDVADRRRREAVRMFARGSGGSSERDDRLVGLIALERAFRAVVLVAVGIVLVTHPHANWASEIARLSQKLGLDPKDNWIQRLIDKVRKIHAHQDVVFGVAALAYGVLEGAEAYGLFRRRAWGEWLTVVATSLLFIPEVWELTKSLSLLKFGAIVANMLIVAYLVWRLRRHQSRDATSA